MENEECRALEEGRGIADGIMRACRVECGGFESEGDLAFLFERLMVYQGAIDLAERVLTTTGRFPRRFDFLASQSGRAVVSVAANLAEAQGRWSSRERRQFVVVARGSLMECVALVTIAARPELISTVEHQQLREQMDRLGRMLTGLMKRAVKD